MTRRALLCEMSSPYALLHLGITAEVNSVGLLDLTMLLASFLWEYFIASVSDLSSILISTIGKYKRSFKSIPVPHLHKHDLQQ